MEISPGGKSPGRLRAGTHGVDFWEARIVIAMPATLLPSACSLIKLKLKEAAQLMKYASKRAGDRRPPEGNARGLTRRRPLPPVKSAVDFTSPRCQLCFLSSPTLFVCSSEVINNQLRVKANFRVSGQFPSRRASTDDRPTKANNL